MASKTKTKTAEERAAAREQLRQELQQAKQAAAQKKQERKAAAPRPPADLDTLGKASKDGQPDLRVAVYAQAEDGSSHLAVPGKAGPAVQALCNGSTLVAATLEARVFKAVAMARCLACRGSRMEQLQAAKLPVWTLPKGGSQPGTLRGLVREQAA